MQKSKPASKHAKGAAEEAVRFLEDNTPWQKGDVATVSEEQAAKFCDKQGVAVRVDE